MVAAYSWCWIGDGGDSRALRRRPWRERALASGDVVHNIYRACNWKYVSTFVDDKRPEESNAAWRKRMKVA